MNKKILFSLVLALMIVLGGISNVNAATAVTFTNSDFTDAKNNPEVTRPSGIMYHEDGHDKIYILPENVDIILDGVITLNSGAEIEIRNNNLTLNSNVVLTGGIKTESSTTNTINGSGIVNGEVKQYGGTATINGSIIFNGTVTSDNATSTIINGGTYNDSFIGDKNTTVTINAGTFKSGSSTGNAVDSYRWSEFTINGGTFTGDVVGYGSEAGKTTIKGGTFTGGAIGAIIVNDESKIYGGTFKTTATDGTFGGNYGAIAISNSLTFEGILASGYKYSTSMDYTSLPDPMSYKLLNARETLVTVAGASGTPETGNSTNTASPTNLSNPNTADPYYSYLIILGLGILGVISSVIYLNRNKLKLVRINK